MTYQNRRGPWEDRPRPRGRFGTFLAGFLVGAVVVVGSVALGARLPEAGRRAESSIVPAGGDREAVIPAGAPDSFSSVYERVSPAVVSIYAATRTPARLVTPYGLSGPARLIPPMEALSSGSGFFISSDGYIVTNNHVVEGANQIVVALADGERVRAELVGRDPDLDLAVIRVQGRGFPFVNFATSSRPKVGDWVIAVGNPFGIGTTATAGIVSAFGQGDGSGVGDYLQLDAAINRGNSGGPTFDTEGRVVGVNTAIFSPTGVFVGIGFAIPADAAEAAVRRIIAGR
jgi:serine protease Do